MGQSFTTWINNANIILMILPGARDIVLVKWHIKFLMLVCLCAFIISTADASNDEKIYIKLGDSVHLHIPSLTLSAYNCVFSYGNAWHSKVIDENTYLIQHNRWKDFYWKIDAINSTVYKIKGSISDYSGETGTVVKDIIFNPSDVIILIFTSSYLEIDTRNGTATLILGETELASKEDFELKQVSPSIFHLREKFWKNFFWKIDSEKKKVYLVREGNFGTLEGGKETALNTQGSISLREEPRVAKKSDEIIIHIGKEVIRAKQYEIIYKTPVSFTVPTVSMLLKYRPHVRDHFGYDESKYSFFDIVSDVSYKISVAKIYEEKVWVGFSFYEGEGFEGYGGIGFYDIQKNLIGVLRHPALVDCSVKDLLIDNEKIYIQTIGNYELETTICNGIVVIDRKNLSTYALVPSGGNILWSKDEPANVPEFYKKPIEEIYKDNRLKIGHIQSWDDKTIAEIKEKGLEQYMTDMASSEALERKRAVSDSRQVVKRTVTLKDKVTERNEMPIKISYEYSHDDSVKVELVGGSKMLFVHRNPTRLCPVDWIAYVYFTASGELHDFKSPLIYPPMATIISAKDTPWVYADIGKKWKFETSKHVFEVTLEDFESKPLKCFTERGKLMDNRFFGMDALFDSITFTIVINELRE